MNGSQAAVVMIALRGLRNALVSVVDQIDVVLDLSAQPEEPEKETCTHPPRYRQPQPSMGHASRFLCVKCGQVVEG